jgi:hypothetical protein
MIGKGDGLEACFLRSDSERHEMRGWLKSTRNDELQEILPVLEVDMIDT